MAKRIRWDIPKILKLAAIVIPIVAVVVLWSLWNDYKAARRASSLQRQANEEALSYTAPVDIQGTPEKRIQSLARAVSEQKSRIDRLTARVGEIERRVRETNTLANTMSQQVSDLTQQTSSVSQNLTQIQARLERLEKILDKIVKSGGVVGATGTAAPAPVGGGTTTPAGSVVYGTPPKTQAATPPSSAAQKPPQETNTIYIPSGSRMRVRLINNILAPAGGLAQVTGSNSPAYPAFARIVSDVELDDGSTIPTSGGVVLLMCVGDASNERAMPRVKQIRFFDGERYYEISSPEATVFDALDQAPGLLGVLDQSKRGREIAKAAALQATKVVADLATLQSGGLLTSTIPTVNPKTGQLGKPKLNLGAIGWSAAGSALDRFIQFYLDQATQYFDTVHVSRTVILKRHGKKVQVPHEAYIIFTAPAFVQPVQKGGAS